MVERIPGKQRLLNKTVTTLKELSPELYHAKAALLVIDDSYNKVSDIADTVRPRYGNDPKLPVALAEASSAEEGVAWIKMYLTSQDLASESSENEGNFPPLIIAIDGSFPVRNSPFDEPKRGMGLRTAKNIIDFCTGMEGGESFPIPYFIGFSIDFPPNDDLRTLLEANNAGDRYLGDYWHQRDAVIDSIKQLTHPSSK